MTFIWNRKQWAVNAGLAGRAPPSRTIKILAWLITAFLVLNTLGNVVSQSPGERALFTPLSFLTALACFVVSISRA
jgi:hypothetical protein